MLFSRTISARSKTKATATTLNGLDELRKQNLIPFSAHVPTTVPAAKRHALVLKTDFSAPKRVSGGHQVEIFSEVAIATRNAMLGVVLVLRPIVSAILIYV